MLARPHLAGVREETGGVMQEVKEDGAKALVRKLFGNHGITLRSPAPGTSGPVMGGRMYVEAVRPRGDTSGFPEDLQIAILDKVARLKRRGR
jgi:hypothetical protein